MSNHIIPSLSISKVKYFNDNHYRIIDIGANDDDDDDDDMMI